MGQSSRRRRGRSRSVAPLVALLLAGLAAASAPARAQEVPAGEPTTTVAPPTLPPDTTLPTPPPTDPTLPGDPSTTTTDTTLPPPPEDPAANGDAPPETVPPPVTIPPRAEDPAAGIVGRGSYAGQGAFASYAGRVVRVTARTAQARAATTQAALDSAIAARDLLTVRQSQLRDDVARLAREERVAVEALEVAQVELRERAAEAYIRGNVGAAALLTSGDATEFGSRAALLEVMVERDLEAVDAYQDARARVDDDQAGTARELAQVSSQLLAAEEAVAVAESEAAFANRELAVSLAGGNLVIHGFTFPVMAPFNYIDSFGFPRMTGTEYEHWHEGTDIFSPYGNELLAAERGVVTRMGTGTLGGITLWIQGESETAYYYAHLSGYAPGIHEGIVVEAGTVVGYVGDTGNARGTSPHLHFEVHPYRGPAINPYPILVVAQEQPQPEPIRLG